MRIRSSSFVLALVVVAMPAASLAQITPTGVTASSTFFSYDEVDLINDSGLSAGLHDQNFENMWMSDSGDVTPWLVFDLGAIYDLTGASVWQYNNNSGLDRGVNGLTIRTSVNGITFTAATTANLTFSPPNTNVPAQTVPFTATARWVRFEVTSNHGSTEYTGLSEVKFAGAPTPAPPFTGVKTVGTAPGVCATTTEITIAPGTTVYYCYTGTNTGSVDLVLHDLADTQLGAIFTGQPYTLAPGASVNTVAMGITASAVIDSDTTNVATWTAYSAGPTLVGHAQAEATVLVPNLSVELDKTVGTVSGECADTRSIWVPSGTTVYYCYAIEVDGAAVHTHDLVDDQLGTVFSGFSYTVAPDDGEVSTVDMGLPPIAAVITEDTENTAEWTVHIANSTVTARETDSAEVYVGSPSVALAKTVGTTPGVCAATDAITVSAGTTVYYCFTATNTGDVTLEAHSLEDDDLGELLDNEDFDIAPGSSVNRIFSEVVDQTTTSEATWRALARGIGFEDSDSTTVTVAAAEPIPALGAGGIAALALALALLAIWLLAWRR